MRLIHTDGTYQFTPKSKIGEASYAILSHTWEEEGEVLFEDMADIERAKDLTGWRKIEKTCELARKREPPIKYVWVDTCCIDKASSAELSEAINSMFDWYSASKVCFVYLKDFPSAGTTSPAIVDTHIGNVLGGCRWFTRGWTLQELVASKHIEFYDEDWALIGSKVELTPQLSHITRIDEIVLQDAAKRSAMPVGTRMSWAANRETSKEEDIAYCLLGILEVNMPLLYGEGAKRAFVRLQEEVVRLSNDLTLFAWQQCGNSRKYRGIFAESPSEFVNCANLRMPSTIFGSDTEFTLTSRGLRFQGKRFFGAPSLYWGPTDEEPPKEVILPLECLIHKESKNFFTAVKFRRVENVYVRIYPEELSTTSSPYTQWGNRYASKEDVFIPRTLSDNQVKIIGQTTNSVEVSFVYSQAFWSAADFSSTTNMNVLSRNDQDVYLDKPYELAIPDIRMSKSFELAIPDMRVDKGTSSFNRIDLVVVFGTQIRQSSDAGPGLWAYLFNKSGLEKAERGEVEGQPVPLMLEEIKKENMKKHIELELVAKEGGLSETLPSRIEEKRGNCTHLFTASVERPEKNRWSAPPKRDFVIYLSYEKTLSL